MNLRKKFNLVDDSNPDSTNNTTEEIGKNPQTPFDKPIANLYVNFGKNSTESLQLLRENPKLPLVGIYHISDNNTVEIFLAPCIREKVCLIIDEDGKYIRGGEIDKDLEIIPGEEFVVSAEKLNKFNSAGLVPRLIRRSDNEFDEITSHEILLMKLQKQHLKKEFRGFTVTNDDKLVFDWSSASLNSGGKKIRGAKMEEVYQMQIKKFIANELGKEIAPENTKTIVSEDKHDNYSTPKRKLSSPLREQNLFNNTQTPVKSSVTNEYETPVRNTKPKT